MIADCLILMVETLAIRGAIRAANQLGCPRLL